MTGVLDNDTHNAALELTNLRSELRQTKLDLQPRIFDVEMRLAWWRLYAFRALCTGTTILILGTRLILR